jgi:hypothetical protein
LSEADPELLNEKELKRLKKAGEIIESVLAKFSEAQLSTPTRRRAQTISPLRSSPMRVAPYPSQDAHSGL